VLCDKNTTEAEMLGMIPQARYVMIAVPSFAFHKVLKQLQPLYRQQKLIIATKGLTPSSDFLFSSAVDKMLQSASYAFLS
jgi:glycerol-3-phosphate dehydrogenase